MSESKVLPKLRVLPQFQVLCKFIFYTYLLAGTEVNQVYQIFYIYIFLVKDCKAMGLFFFN